MHLGVYSYRTDSIESNVETAAVRVETGNKQLERAVVYKVNINIIYHATHGFVKGEYNFDLHMHTLLSLMQRCSRKLTCVIVSILIGVLIAIIVIILIALAVTGNLGKRS